MTKWKYILSGGFYANGPVALSVPSGDVNAARREIALQEKVSPFDVSDVWETTDPQERKLAELLLSRAQMDAFRDN
jgi:hypothetical protein